MNISWTNALGKSWSKQFLFRTSHPCRCFNPPNTINSHLCVSRMKASLVSEATFFPLWAQVVQKLTQMIGKNVKLYDMVLQFLRTLFLRTRNVHYCTLRAELLMSLHDLEISEICTVDPCHKVQMGVFMESFLEKAQRRRVLSVKRVQTLNLNVTFYSLDLYVTTSSWLTSSLLSFHNPWII